MLTAPARRNAPVVKRPVLLVSGLALVLALSACNRSDPPADQLAEAVEQTVEQQVQPSAEPAGPLAPRDECSTVAGAAEFLAAVRSAVAARDTEAFVALAAEDVMLDFGGGAGQAELRSRLAARDAPLWAELDAVLALGCASSDQALLTLPWHFAQEIEGDPFEVMIVTGAGVPLRAAPAAEAAVVGAVSWDAVTLTDGFEPNAGFVKVRGSRRESPAAQPEVIEGYIESARVRSLVDYRLLAASRNGKWRITSLVAGD